MASNMGNVGNMGGNPGGTIDAQAADDQSMPVRRTVDQKRATHAWTCVAEIVALHDDTVEKGYRGLVRGFGVMVHTNGLGPALAYLYAKRGRYRQHGYLLKHLDTWLRQEQPDLEGFSGNLVDWLVADATSVDAYRNVTVETLALLEWLSRFAEGALKEPDNANSAEP